MADGPLVVFAARQEALDKRQNAAHERDVGQRGNYLRKAQDVFEGGELIEAVQNGPQN